MAAPQVEHIVALFRRGQEVVLDTPEQLRIVIVDNLLCKPNFNGKNQTKLSLLVKIKGGVNERF